MHIIQHLWSKGKPLSTSEIRGKFSIAESASWLMIDKISTIRREVCLYNSVEVVVVACINNRISKYEHCRSQRLSIGHRENQCCKKKGKRQRIWQLHSFNLFFCLICAVEFVREGGVYASGYVANWFKQSLEVEFIVKVNRFKWKFS